MLAMPIRTLLSARLQPFTNAAAAADAALEETRQREGERRRRDREARHLEATRLQRKRDDQRESDRGSARRGHHSGAVDQGSPGWEERRPWRKNSRPKGGRK